jgi:hypothetical protein
MTIAEWNYRDSKGETRTAKGNVLYFDGTDAVIKADGTGEVCTIPLVHLTEGDWMLIDRSDFAGFAEFKDYAIGKPRPDQLKLINSHLPMGSDPFGEDEVVTFPFKIADNLVNRGFDKWDVPSLQRMAKLAPGLPFTQDHDWYQASKIWGTVYSAAVHRMDKPPPEVMDMAGLKRKNDLVVKDEGYVFVVAEVFAVPTNSVAAQLSSGIGGRVSTGKFRFQDLHCPICSTPYTDQACPHVPDVPWWKSDSQSNLVSPYSVRVGLYDLGEISIVVVPNLPAAGLLSGK